jgi:hypothetical protein
MKNRKIASAAFATVVSLTMASPSILAKTNTVSDSQLDAISGTDNVSTVGSTDSTSVIAGIGVGGNIQVGYFQWEDNHEQDNSTNKGGNIQSGDESQVQQAAIVNANGIAWGGMSDSVTINADSPIGGTQKLESWWIMYIGGF